MWLAPLVSHAKAFARARWPASHSRRPVRRKQAPRRARIEQLEGRALLSSYSPFPGVVLGSVDATSSDVGRAAFVDFSDRIVVVGQTVSSGTPGERLALFRYDSEGMLDPTFGTQGVVTTALPRTTSTYGLALAAYPSKTAENPPDRILVGGEVTYRKGNQLFDDFALARYNSNGTLDTTFGSNGTVQTDLGGGQDSYGEAVRSILVLDDGRIVAAGQSQTGATGYCFALACYTADGQLDTTFGTAGVVKGPVGTMNDAIWDQGKILAVGGYQGQFVLARYDLNGELDTTFNGGIVTTSFDTSAGAFAAAVYPGSENPDLNAYEGYIVTVGSAAVPNNTCVALARYRPDGSLDPTFGSGGKVFTPGFLGGAADVAIQTDGSIVVGGRADGVLDPSTGQYLKGLMVARYNFDGTVDTSFGTDGITVTPILNATTYPAVARSMAVQSDGKFVLAGYAHEGTRNFVALARYLPDGTLDETFGVPAPPPPGITVTPTSGLVTTEAGGTASFSVVLNSRPTADVTIALSSSDTTEGTVSVAMLTFSPANWNTPLIVTVSGVDDTIRDGDKAYTIVLGPADSSDSRYSGLDPSDVSVTNKDNEKGKITGSALSPGTLTDAALAGLANSDFQRRKSKAKSGPTEAAFSADLPLWEA